LFFPAKKVKYHHNKLTINNHHRHKTHTSALRFTVSYCEILFLTTMLKKRLNHRLNPYFY